MSVWPEGNESERGHENGRKVYFWEKGKVAARYGPDFSDGYYISINGIGFRNRDDAADHALSILEAITWMDLKEAEHPRTCPNAYERDKS